MIEKAIAVIKREKIVSSSTLSDRLGITKSKAENLLKILEEQGILRKLGIQLSSTMLSTCSLAEKGSMCSKCNTKGCIMKFLFSSQQ